MSRIGKLPVSLPDKVNVEVLPGNVLKVKGPLGELSQKVDPDIKVTIEDNEIKFERPTDQPRHRSMHGLYRALVNNMVQGVSKGFETKQEFVGVGYRVVADGQLLTMSLGYSHEIQLLLAPEIKAETPAGEKNKARNTLYSIEDNYFAFYFRFIYKHLNMLNGLISPTIYYSKEFTTDNLNTYIGHRFEQICSQFLKEKAFNGELPFFAEEIGRWWGNNPIEKRQEEIDIVAINQENAIICE